jgi:hypothetical protein
MCRPPCAAPPRRSRLASHPQSRPSLGIKVCFLMRRIRTKETAALRQEMAQREVREPSTTPMHSPTPRGVSSGFFGLTNPPNLTTFNALCSPLTGIAAHPGDYSLVVLPAEEGIHV